MTDLSDYLDYSGADDQFTGGINMIPIETPRGTFRVWTRRVGNSPKIRVLLLHGGPGATHELFECFDGWLPREGIEYIYYDQIDSYYSDQPGDPTLWTIEHFVDEVEQVRRVLGLNPDNFFLLGQSWGGMLAMEYAFAHQRNLKGLIISNMVSDVGEYNRYARDVLGPQMDPEVFAEIQRMEAEDDYENPRYEELLMQHHYTEHVLRMPLEDWPDSIMRTFKHINKEIYVHMQGYSEFGMTPGATLAEWNRSADLSQITVPTLTIGAAHDTMNPKHMEWMAGQVGRGRYLHCPDGSHLAQYDDQKTYMMGLVRFLRDVDAGNL
ncbi:proline iminopeptidase-family hydrolase [Wenzhouxiangella sp. XN201]|uniref:proline iminopeptidase-family hydrolase n=1 Tax=Wenzhouxiangella sp. XN201 TaxID=2710755 RepID=UPI0013CC6C07|nr:proline iminopeptidase-family hydrolase [Wenzhouxiangella sp. XN201]NEZ03087.1 proline iminopeptidase-family hydrolase [Wenzhouxiangella sp. XN201]